MRKYRIKATIGVIGFLVVAIIISYFIAKGLFAISNLLQPFAENIEFYGGLLALVLFFGSGIFYAIQIIAEEEKRRDEMRKLRGED